MTSGNKNFSAGYITHTLDWSGDDDPVFKKAINRYSKSRLLQINPWATINQLDGTPFLSRINGRWVKFTAHDSQVLDMQLAARAAVAVRRHSFNVGVSAAEFAKTVALIANAARGVSDILTGIHSAAFRYSHNGGSLARGSNRGLANDLMSTQEFIQSLWLQARYGWRPLLSDAYNVGEAAATLLTSPTPWSTVSSNVFVPLEFTIEGYTKIFAFGQAQYSKRLKFRLKGDPSIPTHLGLNDPLSILWELLPYSFVLDWFVPIGSFLKSYEGLSGVDAETILNTRERVRVDGVDVAGDGGAIGVLPYRESSFSFNRTSPSLESLIPSVLPVMSMGEAFRGQPGVNRVLDSIALIGNTVSKLLRLH